MRFGQCAYEINFAPSVEILLESNYEKNLNILSWDLANVPTK